MSWKCQKCGYTNPQQLVSLRELIDHTGWKRWYVEHLVEQGRLKTWRMDPRGKPRYFINSVHAILDGRG